jgi:hypothetical protein
MLHFTLYLPHSFHVQYLKDSNKILTFQYKNRSIHSRSHTSGNVTSSNTFNKTESHVTNLSSNFSRVCTLQILFQNSPMYHIKSTNCVYGKIVWKFYIFDHHEFEVYIITAASFFLDMINLEQSFHLHV